MQVSIVVPTYNRASLLKQTLESVLAQSYQDWECIVVDDGSTDETEEITGHYGPDIHYVRQENAGPAVARNRGIEKAEGDAVFFLDSDDLLLPHAMEVLVGQLNRHPEAGVAYGGFYGFYPDGCPGKIPELPHLPPGDYSSPWPEQGHRSQDVRPYGLTSKGQVLPDLLKHDAILMGASLVRRSVVEKSQGFDPRLDFMEHWDFFLRLAQMGVRFTSACEPVLRVRMHDGNLSSDFEEMLHFRLDLIDKYLPTGHLERENLREKARANAFAFLGVCMCSAGQIEEGLRHLRATLKHRPLTLESYDAITQKLCKKALSSTDPEQKIQSLLNLLGSSTNARSLRHFVMSRFYRVLAAQKLQSAKTNGTTPWREPRLWSDWASAGVKASLSGLHLGRAVMSRPKLGQAYANRLMRLMQ